MSRRKRPRSTFSFLLRRRPCIVLGGRGRERNSPSPTPLLIEHFIFRWSPRALAPCDPGNPPNAGLRVYSIRVPDSNAPGGAHPILRERCEAVCGESAAILLHAHLFRSVGKGPRFLISGSVISRTCAPGQTTCLQPGIKEAIDGQRTWTVGEWRMYCWEICF